MKVGIMLRHYGQHEGGVRVYTQNLLTHLLSSDSKNHYTLIYQNPKFIGTYAAYPNVEEVAVGVREKFLWDQVAIPSIVRKRNLDLIFNPKYSLPLMVRCRTVFVCHGLDWYVMPWGSRWIDRLSHRYLIPMYARKADAIISVSNTTRQHLIEYLKVDEDRIHTVYHGVDQVFREPIPGEKLEAIRRRYHLPDRFFLYCGRIYPAKNFGRLLQAYAQVGPKMGIPLVVAGGVHSWGSEGELALIKKLGLAPWVIFPGWIDHNTLPAFYAAAEALLFPSLYESFGFALLEAMSCGCPVVTANRYGPQEMVGQAGILVDPEDVESIAGGISQMATDGNLRQRLIKAGYERARGFTWGKCAQETLRVLEHVMTRT